MTLYRRLFRTTQPLILASVAGSAMWTVPSASHAQQLMSPVTSAGPALEVTPAPVLISPTNTASAAQLTPVPHPLAPSPQVELLHPPTHRAGHADGQVRQIQHQSSDPSLLDRFKGVFRGRGPAPVDPGMTYPKAKEARQQGNMSAIPNAPMVPGVSEEIPLIPPMRQSSQPGLFQPPTAANPIHDLVPPSPAGAMAEQSLPGGGNLPQINPPPPVASNGGPLIPPTPDGGTPSPQVRRVSELAPYLSPETRVADASQGQNPTSSPTSNLPRLDFNAPIPEPVPAKMIAPGEPSDTGIAVTPAPQAAPAQPKDPFADLFPGDAKSASTQTPAPPADSGSPYTGKSLDSAPELAASSGRPSMDLLPPSPEATETPGLPSAPTVPSLSALPSAPPASFEAPVLTPSEQVKLQPAGQLPPVPPPYTAEPSRTALVPTPTREAPLVPAEPKPEITIRPAPTQDQDSKSKFQLIASRQGQTGLKGFCPVVLRDSRDLVNSSSEFRYQYNGKMFEFSSAEAMEKFAADPLKYAPANGCSDVIHLALTGEKLEGSLDHAVWYKGRLYLFSSVETMETFVAAPSSHASND